MKIRCAGKTDPGRKRGNNEDSFFADEESGLFVVADGVGGSAGGEVASRIAVETLAAVLPGLLADQERTVSADAAGSGLAALREAAGQANRAIRVEQSRRPETAAMATTLTGLLVRNGRACLVHVGDSRAYLLRAKELQQLSADHTLVADSVRSGLLTLEESRRSPYRHVISRALGIEDEIVPDTAAQPVLPGDTFLLCTDGLTDMLPDGEIAAILGAYDPDDAVRELIAEANRAGGDDNITTVVVRTTER